MIWAVLSLSVVSVGQLVAFVLFARHTASERAQMRREAWDDRDTLLIDAHDERQALLQRIQAPEVAVAQAIPDAPAGLLHVPLDDFEAYEQDLKEQLNGV